MENKIKNECEFLYARIKDSQDRLKEIREICPHPSVSIKNYSYRIGVIRPAEVCDDCGELIKYVP